MENRGSRIANHGLGRCGSSIFDLRSSILVWRAPASAIGQGGRGRVEENDARIEAMAGADRAVHPPAIAEMGRQATDLNVPVVPRSVQARIECNLDQRIVAVERVNDQSDSGAVPAQEREVDAGGGRQGGGTQWQGTAAVSAK